MPGQFSRDWRGVLLAVIMAGAAITLGGCGLSEAQRGAVASYSQAAITLGDTAAAEFRKSRADVVEMNIRRFSLGDDKVDLTRLDQPLTLEHVRVRTAAAEALADYGRLMKTLGTDTQSAEIHVAAESLRSSLARVSSVRLSAGQAGAIGGLVERLGGMAVEGYRAERVREIATTSGPAVRQLAGLIEEDFEAEGEAWTLGFDLVVTRLTDKAGDFKRAAKTPGETAYADESLAMAAERRARFTAVAARVHDAAEALVAAEKEVQVALQYKPLATDDINALIAKVQELVSVAKALRP